MEDSSDLSLKSLLITIISIFLVCSTTTFPSSRGEEDDDRFRECSRGYECGELRNLSYPFWGGDRPPHCGHPDFHVTCEPSNHSVFRVDNVGYSILSLKHSDRNNTLRVARFDMLDGPCSRQVQHVNTTTWRYLQYGLDVHFAPTVKNLNLFYGCKTPEAASFPYQFFCPEESETVFYANDSLLESLEPNRRPGSCSEVVWVPIFPDALDESPSSGDNGTEEVGRALSEGFEVIYPESEICKECEDSGGICGYYSTTPDHYFRCFCRDGVKTGFCIRPHGRDWKLKIIIGVCAAFAGIAVMSVICFFYQCRNRKKYAPSSLLFRNISSEISSGKGKDVEKGSTYLGVHLFSYEELVEATKNFDSSKELGDGGFGTVYYGELRDGRAVAVKRLYESNCRRVEQFMNEVEILAHLRHRNLVSLYGCTSRRSHELLLVYEYIPNGTVADHLHGEKAKPGELPWPIRLNIAIETAYALTYLHASEIIHRDVKTNNILLDKNFSVKVADFGLSRLFPTHVTHVSTAPQGTPGYVDPEYHQCYQLTSKSDVFSFGVVLMELVSSMPAVDITRHRHDINLSTMAMNRIQNHALHELVDPSLGFDSDSRVRKMITAVAELAFQCLQHEKDMRPSMADVLEELKAIQSRDNETEKAEKKDSAADDAVLLKNGPLTLSPDTVTINWSSRNTTPNASG